MPDYTPNSHKYRQEQQKKEKEAAPDKKIEKVVNGATKSKKRAEMRKFTETFLQDDVSSVKEYLLYDVAVPALKNTIVDIFTGGITRLLLGEGARGTSRSTASRVSYRDYYARPSDRRDYGPTRTRASFDYDDIVIPTRGEAEEVLYRMEELIAKYGMASIADLNELCGITGNYTDNKYGWTDLRSASVAPVRGGYRLKLPRAGTLDD